MQLRLRPIKAALFLVMVTGFVATTPVLAGSPPTLRADLEGEPIEVTEVSSYFCHDFDYPDIHCFSNPEDLGQSLIEDFASSGVDDSLTGTMLAAAFGPNDYVTIYSGSSYAGTFAHLAQNYDSLAAIGWNDNISSFKGRNSRRGMFREHWFATGATTNFCCNQNTPSLPSGVDNTFSSVYRT